MRQFEHHFKVAWSAEDQQWLGTCDEYPSLSWLADTHGRACSGICELAFAVRDDQTVDDTRLNQVVQTLRAVIAKLDDDARCILDEIRNESEFPLRAHNRLFQAQMDIDSVLRPLSAAVAEIEEVLPIAYIPDGVA